MVLIAPLAHTSAFHITVQLRVLSVAPSLHTGSSRTVLRMSMRIPSPYRKNPFHPHLLCCWSPSLHDLRQSLGSGNALGDAPALSKSNDRGWDCSYVLATVCMKTGMPIGAVL